MRQGLLLTPLVCLSLLLCAKAIAANSTSQDSQVQHYSYQVLAERSHNAQLFTQGLVLYQDHFYESSGLYQQSLLVSYPVAEPVSKWAKSRAKFTQKYSLAPHFFAEGMTVFNNKLYLLTWQEQTLLVFNVSSFAPETSFSYTGEGWGLTHNQEYLIRSDGSHQLTFHSPNDFTAVSVLAVHEQGRPLTQLNELEFIKGKIWANIWHQNRLVEIDPVSGAVTGQVDLSALAQQFSLHPEAVLNGIAYDAQLDALWVTGKFWPRMFLIKLSALEQPMKKNQ